MGPGSIGPRVHRAHGSIGAHGSMEAHGSIEAHGSMEAHPGFPGFPGGKWVPDRSGEALDPPKYRF